MPCLKGGTSQSVASAAAPGFIFRPDMPSSGEPFFPPTDGSFGSLVPAESECLELGRPTRRKLGDSGPLFCSVGVAALETPTSISMAEVAPATAFATGKACAARRALTERGACPLLGGRTGANAESLILRFRRRGGCKAGGACSSQSVIAARNAGRSAWCARGLRICTVVQCKMLCAQSIIASREAALSHCGTARSLFFLSDKTEGLRAPGSLHSVRMPTRR